MVSRSRTLAFALTSTIWVLASAVGPVLGGLFSTTLSWRWCFWINVPICFTSFILLFFLLDVHNPKTAFIPGMKAIDWFGSLSVVGMTVMVLLGLEFGGVTFPWNSTTVICLIIFGVGMVGAFLYSEGRLAKYPLIPFGLFDNWSNIACLILCFGHGMVCAFSYHVYSLLHCMISSHKFRSI
jgi:MFS family permease